MLVKRLLSMQRSSFWPKMLLVAFLAFLIISFALPHLALAQTQDYGLGAVRSWGIFGEANIFVFIGRLIQVFFGILGVVAVIIIMYAGFIWMTASGDPNKVATAKKILTNAIIGLIIIFMAFAIVTFVIGRLQGIAPPPGGPGNYPGSPYDPYRSAIGRGPIESVYPAPNASNIPINTWIAVTFKEPIEWDSVHVTSGMNALIKNIEICEISARGNSCLGSASSTFTAAAMSSSAITITSDHKTIVITPNQWLGNEDSQTRTFKVLLKKEINSLATGKSIFGTSFGYYEWAFKTNGRLDLDPPEIISSNDNMLGVYPLPDNLIDSYSGATAAVKGRATATFSNMPVTNSPTLINGVAFNGKAEVRLTSETPNIPPSLEVKIKTESGYDFSGGDKTVTMTVSEDGTSVTFGGEYAALGLTATYPIVGTTVNTAIGLTIEGNGPLPQGSIWQFTVKPSRLGDTFVINTSSTPYRFVFVGDNDTRQTIITREIIGGRSQDINYQTVKIGTSPSTAAYNLANAINLSQANFYIQAVAPDEKMILEAKVAGSNNVGFTTASSVISLSSGNLAGGAPAQFGRVKSGNQDAYNNTIFQINFNEAINPAFVDNIKVYKDGALLNGSVTISNQYRTIEIKGPNECGVNSCGDKMYCWLDTDIYPSNNPVSIPFRVEIAAASLKTCSGSDAWCTGSFGGTCEAGGRCFKNIGSATAYFPQANIGNINGIIDMCGNSFNGSFNTTTISGKVTGISEGQSGISPASGGSGHNPFIMSTSTYPAATSTYGDNFAWNFYVSNEIDNYSPLLGTIDPTGEYDYGYNATEDFSRPVWLNFDRLMSFSTLKPGWGYDGVKNSKAWNNRFLALTTMTQGANPVGFWIGSGNVDRDGDNITDYTLAGIEHNRFDRSVRYAPLAGSGVMSITQNCFLPSKGPADAGSGECKYESGNPAGCSPSALPNPASYAKLKCTEIEGGKVCDSGHTTCKALYYNKNDFGDTSATSTDRAGSWVITSEGNTMGSGGCCLGKCVDAAGDTQN